MPAFLLLWEFIEHDKIRRTVRQTVVSKFSDPKPWEIHEIPKNCSIEVLNKAQIAWKPPFPKPNLLMFFLECL